MKRPRPIVQRARAFAHRAFALAVAVVILVGIARAGSRYFYCPMMETVSDSPCCAGDGRAPSDTPEGPVADAPDCCQSKRFELLPSASAHGSLEWTPSLAVVAAPPTSFALRLALLRSVVPAAPAPRAGAPPPPARRRASLMVWNS